MDHHQLNFWLWAFLRNGKAYLDQSNITHAAFENMFSDEPNIIAREQYQARALELRLADDRVAENRNRLTLKFMGGLNSALPKPGCWGKQAIVNPACRK